MSDPRVPYIDVQELQQFQQEMATKLHAAVSAQLNFIQANKEKLVQAWVAEHGWNPSECCLMQQDMQNGTIRMWVEKRGEHDELQRFREREPLVQALVKAVDDIDSYDLGAAAELAAKAVRDFKVTP